MTERGQPSPHDARRPARARLVPPRVGEVERRTRESRTAERWARSLRGDKRRRMAVLGGNLLLAALLLGLPWLRGSRRALATREAHARFTACALGARVSGGLGDAAREPEFFAAQLLRLDRARLARCGQLLDALAPAPALFVLPSVKAAEERTREAVAIARTELAALARYAPGKRMPERPLRALRLLRATVHEQMQQASLLGAEPALPLELAGGAVLPAPARLPLYAAKDAALSLSGDDHALRVSALDATGLSYLQIDPGHPFTRARLVRPPALRGLVPAEQGEWLVWATAPARCAERAAGCFGKTSRVAAAPSPLLELPASRALAGHLAGRPDRSVVVDRATLRIAMIDAARRAQVQEFTLPREFVAGTEVPPLSAARTWQGAADQLLLLAAQGQTLALGVERAAGGARVSWMSARAATPLFELELAGVPWITGCAQGERAGVVLGDGEQLQVVELRRGAAGWQPRRWQPLALATKQVIDPELAFRDRVLALCTGEGPLVFARDADGALRAIVCRPEEPQCRQVAVASGVDAFSALATPTGALVAYAGDEAPQIRVRALDRAAAALRAERVPAACWTSHGLCARPTLARLGRRILLLAPDGTDLLALESADEGQSWSAPPVL